MSQLNQTQQVYEASARPYKLTFILSCLNHEGYFGGDFYLFKDTKWVIFEH